RLGRASYCRLSPPASMRVRRGGPGLPPSSRAIRPAVESTCLSRPRRRVRLIGGLAGRFRGLPAFDGPVPLGHVVRLRLGPFLTHVQNNSNVPRDDRYLWWGGRTLAVGPCLEFRPMGSNEKGIAMRRDRLGASGMVVVAGAIVILGGFQTAGAG